jgi:phosphoenolpyruvate-protein kinase (PTS system EI component)
MLDIMQIILREDNMKIVNLKIDDLKPYDKNPRKNENAVDEVAKSLKEFGFRQPLVIDENHVVIVGHTRLLAAKKLGLKEVPCHIAKDLSEAKIKAYRIMDNRTSEFSDWDKDLLTSEMLDIIQLEPLYSADFLGFEVDSIDEPAKEENWDLSQSFDQSIISITVPVEDQNKILEKLCDIDPSNIKVTTIKKALPL